MNTLEPPPIPAAPAPFPRNRIPPDYRERVRRYATAQRGFYARSAWRRTLAIVLTAAIAAIVADIRFELPETWRWAILGTLAFVGVILLVLWWLRPVLALGENVVIRKLEHSLPELGQRLRTSREAENATCDPGLTGVFASGLVADTRVRMSGIDLDALIPWKTIRLSLYACLVVTAAFLVLLAGWPDFRVGAQRLLTPGAGATFTTVTIEDAPDSFKEGESPLIVAVVSGRPTQETILFTREEGQDWKPQKMDRGDTPGRFNALLMDRKDSFEYYVAAGDARSETRSMRCLLTPRIEKVENEVRMPDYIGVPPIKTAGGDVKAVEDSMVTVDFQIQPPLTDATAHLSDGRDLPLKIVGGHVMFELKVTRGEVTYQLSGSDADHLYLPPTTFKITGFEDKPPEVELVEPKKDLEATTVWEILARLRAKDDFGLAEVGIVLVVGNEIKMVAHRDIAEKNVRSVSEMGTAALEDFPLTINDNLKIYAFARDHKPRDGARSVSRLVAIDIRQFQVRWRLMKGGGGGKPPMSGEHLANFFALIKEQRQIVSDTFLLTENGVPSGGDLGAECDKIRTHEDTVAAQATKLKDKVAEEGTMSADDLTLLDTAAQQMGEASSHLAQKLPRPAYKQAHRALSSLLALRKKIMKLMSQSKSAMPSEAEDPPKATNMSDLAAEAERLAHEEHDVREKITPQLPAARDLEVTRHQQEVAVTDAGELFAALVRHPGTSELALQRMESAEGLMQKAEDQMKGAGAAAQEAAPGLKSAEDVLTALAAQLRALDEKNMEETMGKLAQMAKEAKEQMEKEQQARDQSSSKSQAGSQSGGSQAGEQPNASDNREVKARAKNDGHKNTGDDQKNSASSDRPAAKEKGTNPQEGGAEPKASDAREGKTGAQNENPKAAGDAPEKSGDQGKQEAKSAGEDSKATADAKENGQANDGHDKGQAPAVDEKADGKMGEKGEKGNGKTNDANGKGLDTADRVKALEQYLALHPPIRENGQGDADRKKPAGTGPHGFDKTAENAATIDDALKALAGREGAGKEGERLAELRDQTRTGTLRPDVHALAGEKNDAAAAEKAGGLSERFGKLADGLNAERRHLLQSHIEALTDLLARTRKLEEKAGEKGAAGKEGKGEGEEQRAEGKPEGLSGKQPGETPQVGPGEKAADAKSENKEKEGTEAANNRSENTTQPAGKKAATGPHGRRDGPGALGGGGAQTARGPYGGIRDIDPIRNEYLQDLDRIADEHMRGLLAPLIEDVRRYGAFDYSHLQPVAERLAKMLDDLVRDKSGVRHASGVPDEYSHLVDEYFRALSEDYRSDARTPPEQSSPRK